MLEPSLISPTPSMVETPDTARTSRTTENPFSKKKNPFDSFSTPVKDDALPTPKRIFAPSLGASLTPSLEEEEFEGKSTEKKRMLTQRLTPKSKWQNATKCKCCDSPFGAIKRRHHCRKCGASCCQKCSRSRMTVGNEEIRVCQSCSDNMFVSDVELENVREELIKLRREFRDVNEKFGREKVLNSKYSQDIETLNHALSEQKRRASLQRREMTKMSDAVSLLKDKIENCERDQVQMRDDHKQALKLQQDNFKEDFDKIKQIQNETSALLSGDAPPLPRDPPPPLRSTRRVGGNSNKKETDAACACLIS